jgi:hypothetical protein
MHVRRAVLGLVVLSLVAGPSRAQEAEAPDAAPAAVRRPFRLGGEFKLAFRNSKFVETPLFFPFPPDFIPPGQTAVFQRTVDAGSSLEVPNLALIAEGEPTSGMTVKAEVHVLDLYNRNPTFSDDRILLREAWVLIGTRPGFLELPEGSSFYVLAGLAPRFTKQIVRRLESYGLWGTAVGRFENPQLQVGGSLGRNLYFRALVGNGNPLFFRDTNALAGDNGTPERVPGNVDPVYESGFPILYDAKPADLNVSGRFEWGAGLGARFAGESWALDAIGWYFHRRMEDAARIRGTFYEGDLDLLRGVAFPLPFSGDEKSERGVNVEARAGGLRFFGQYVDQTIAELPRSGFEVELAYRLRLDGLFVVGETPIGEALQPVVRYSKIDNDFTAPREYPGLSVAWDWTKLDLGLRIDITRSVDLTIEYSRHDMVTARGTLHPDETLITLRTGF